MKPLFLKRPEKDVPLLIGSILMFNGIVHILISACLFIKLPVYFLYEIQTIIDFTAYQSNSALLGIFLGFALLIVGKGICERKRQSWVLAIIFLSILIVNTYYFRVLPKTHFPNAILLVMLLASYRWFNVRNEIAMGYQQIVAWTLLIIAIVYGVCGSYLHREEFANLKTWGDAIYFTFVTYSTLGYGDIYPLTVHAKSFTVSMIVVGIGAFATLFTFLIEPLLENRIKGVLNIMKKINNINNHVIICGYTRLSVALIKQLEKNNVPFIILENSVEKKAEIEEKYITIAGNTFQKETFLNAKISHAESVITAFDNDSDNILTLLTVSEIIEETRNSKTKIISRIDNEENIEKAKKLGASEVVSPTKMAASFIMESSLK